MCGAGFSRPRPAKAGPHTIITALRDLIRGEDVAAFPLTRHGHEIARTKTPHSTPAHLLQVDADESAGRFIADGHRSVAGVDPLDDAAKNSLPLISISISIVARATDVDPNLDSRLPISIVALPTGVDLTAVDIALLPASVVALSASVDLTTALLPTSVVALTTRIRLATVDSTLLWLG